MSVMQLTSRPEFDVNIGGANDNVFHLVEDDAHENYGSNSKYNCKHGVNHVRMSIYSCMLKVILNFFIKVTSNAPPAECLTMPRILNFFSWY